MQTIAALGLAALALAACDSMAPAAPDPARPSLSAGTAGEAPAPQPVGGLVPAVQPAPGFATDRGYLQAWPTQQQVLDQQRSLLGSDIRLQDANRTQLQQQLQQGAARDQQDALRLQQQLEQQRRNW